jgi:hypothetical protein
MDEAQKTSVARLAERMEAVRDDLRVRLHLAGMEAKQAWDRAHLERVQDELARIRDEMKVQAHLAGMDAKEAWSKLESRLEALRGQAGGAKDAIAKELESAMSDVARALRAAMRKPEAQSPSS